MTLESQSKKHRFTTCHRHPREPVTGFCASCLRERLSGLDPGGRNSPSASSSFPELRRCKSYSGNGRPGFAGNFEPRRKSCDVRARNSLASLFNLDDKRNGLNIETEIGTRNLGFSEIVGTVVEVREEETDGEEIKAFEENEASGVNFVDEREKDVEEEVEFKTMKEFIDLEFRRKKHSSMDFKNIAGSFWVAASVFSKKLGRWRQKQSNKRQSFGGEVVEEMNIQKVNGRHLRETQSEIGDYGFDRRSCDTDPRLSVDIGRFSLDGPPRYSFDEPRASWDGYMIGRALPKLASMDVNVVVNMNRLSFEESNPGGSTQTRDYYRSDSVNRRRKSLDRLGSIRKVEIDDVKSISNAKVSPTTVELFHGAKVLIEESDLNANCLKDDCSERVSASKDGVFVANGGNRKGLKKYLGWRKSWSFWGMLNKHSENKYEDMGDGSSTESFAKVGRVFNGEAKGVYGDNVIRTNGVVGSPSSCKLVGSFRNMRTNADIKGHVIKRREHFLLERNRSARYSPNNLDNGLLRFYLTPLRSSKSRCGKSKLKNSHSLARSVLRLP